MSYATRIKEIICAQPPQKLCCRRALLNGILYVSAARELSDENVNIYISGKEIAAFVTSLIDSVFHAPVTVSTRRGGGGAVALSFRSTSATKYMRDITENDDKILLAGKCEECRTYFLRGIFISCAHPTDPSGDFRLDITPRYGVRMLSDFLADIGLPPHKAMRQGREILYYHKGEQIADFFGQLALMDVYFELQNEYLKRDLSNLTNRQNNCTVRNIARSVDILSEQVRLIRRMKEENKLSLLPDDLKMTAELRLKYDDYSLARLASVSVPPMTKSGMNHRLKKIMDVAKKLYL